MKLDTSSFYIYSFLIPRTFLLSTNAIFEIGIECLKFLAPKN